MGVDSLGRRYLVEILWGLAISLAVGFLSVAIGCIRTGFRALAGSMEGWN